MAMPADKINVLFIIKPERAAGAEMVLLEAAARLNRESFNVFTGLLTPDREHLVPPHLTAINFNLPGLNGWVWLRFFLHLCWVLYRQKIQIVHTNSYVPGNYARLAAAILRVPAIMDHWHGFTHFTRKRRLICRWLGRITDLSLAVSKGVKDYLIEQCLLNPAKVRVVHNGVDLARLQQHRPRLEVRKELGLSEDTKVVGLVARLDHWGKGHREFFEALAALKDRFPLEALIIGGGRREAEMQQLAAGKGLAGRVHFLGQRQDIPGLLAALDIFVLPSHSEGVSLALLEAMAAGLPVIVSRVGGLPEVVTDGENGLLIPPKTPEALAQALERLLVDPAFSKNLGEKARRQVETNYSLDRLGREINEIYLELIEKKKL
ncbi:MAG: glycosyltransferase [Deltaproteobacteria bacterium]|nr:glycosyltransferase [Deltaproteobacteria bacterium]